VGKGEGEKEEEGEKREKGEDGE
jgi:hypothetical protein